MAQTMDLLSSGVVTSSSSTRYFSVTMSSYSTYHKFRLICDFGDQGSGGYAMSYLWFNSDTNTNSYAEGRRDADGNSTYWSGDMNVGSGGNGSELMYVMGQSNTQDSGERSSQWDGWFSNLALCHASDSDRASAQWSALSFQAAQGNLPGSPYFMRLTSRSGLFKSDGDAAISTLNFGHPSSYYLLIGSRYTLYGFKHN